MGIPGCPPQNNSIERWHRKIKGDQFTLGHCDFGKSLDAMMNQELPRLVWLDSTLADGFRIDYRLRNQDDCTRDSKLMGLVSSMGDMDYFPNHASTTGDETYYYNNHREDFGWPVTYERIQRMISARHGFSEMFANPNRPRPEDRFLLYEDANSLVVVKKMKYPDGVWDWGCDCKAFYQVAVCPHTYHCKFGRDGGLRPADNPKKRTSSTCSSVPILRRQVPTRRPRHLQKSYHSNMEKEVTTASVQRKLFSPPVENTTFVTAGVNVLTQDSVDTSAMDISETI